MDKKDMDKRRKYFEKEIEGLDNQKYITNWKNLSKRFGKRFLVEVFESADEYLVEGGDFKKTFDDYVLKPVKNKGKSSFIKKEIYSRLMSTFSKYHYFLKEYKKNISNTLEINIDNSKGVKDRGKKEIKDSFNKEKTIYYPKSNLNIRPDEENYFSIVDGEIGLPKSVGNFIIEKETDIEIKDTEEKNKKVNKKSKRKQKKVNNEEKVKFKPYYKKGKNGQMKLNFDDFD